LAAENRPDVIVLDLGLRDARGDVVFDGIRLASPASRVVVYTAHESQQSWYESRGATFVSKSTGSDEIVSALRSA
jgi:DNA-binding NarL/FixJ family response regulator